jgi:transcription elongation factor GreA
MTEEKLLLTADGVKQLQAELDELIQTRRPDILDKLNKAKERADTADSAEYEEVQNEQWMVESRIAELERMLKDAEVMPKEKAPAREVRFGYRVTVENEAGEKIKYTIVGSPESNPNEGKISNESPVAKALLGKHPGDVVTIPAPRGNYTLKIASIAKK